MSILPRYVPTTVSISDEAGETSHDVVLDRESGNVIPFSNVLDAILAAELFDVGARRFDEFVSLTPETLDALGVTR